MGNSGRSFDRAEAAGPNFAFRLLPVIATRAVTVVLPRQFVCAPRDTQFQLIQFVVGGNG